MSQFLCYFLLSFYYNMYARKMYLHQFFGKLSKPHSNYQESLLLDKYIIPALLKCLPAAFSTSTNDASNSHNAEVDQEDLVMDKGQDSDDDNYDDFDMETRCGCGIILSEDNGWFCSNCRVNCPGCNRSLTKNSDEYCTRCYYSCHEHGLIAKTTCSTSRCPGCS